MTDERMILSKVQERGKDKKGGIARNESEWYFWIICFPIWNMKSLI